MKRMSLYYQCFFDKRPAGQKIEDRITLFAAALEASSDGEESIHVFSKIVPVSRL